MVRNKLFDATCRMRQHTEILQKKTLAASTSTGLSFIGLAWHGLGSMTVSVAEATKRPWALSLYASNVQQDPRSGGAGQGLGHSTSMIFYACQSYGFDG